MDKDRSGGMSMVKCKIGKDGRTKGCVLVGVKFQSLWQGEGYYYDVVAVPEGEKPSIAVVGNLYQGRRTWDIERKSDMGRIEFGIRTKSVKRAKEWLSKREPYKREEWLDSVISKAIKLCNGIHYAEE
jgi:hypothetical protein